MSEKILLAFSGGKDSCLALHKLRQSPNLEVAALLTTLTEDYQRISMHGVTESLLDRQAESIGLPLHKVWIPPESSNEIYESRMREILLRHKQQCINRVAFGDLFLADIRDYREEQLGKLDMQGIYPLWDENTKKLARRFLDLGFKSLTCCIDNQALEKKFVGRVMEQSFFEELPDNVDPCGENGEYHSFVYDGPIFQFPLDLSVGEIVLRDERFYFCNLLSQTTTTMPK